VSELSTPTQLAEEIGVSRAAVCAWLRATFPPPLDGRWRLDEEMVARVRERFAATAPLREHEPGPCSVEGCDRVAKGRRLCKMHYDRWYRTGTPDGIGAGGHQRAKTHCPTGHPYTPENTVVYPSEGRRRCRTCREGR
jgi:hypothetical protein